MRVRRFGVLVVVSMLLSILVTGAPVSVDQAEAQATCPVASEADLNACIVQYGNALSGTTVTAVLSSDVPLTAPLPSIANDQAPPATFVIEGNGHTIDATGSPDSDGLWQVSGDVEVNSLTLTGATTDLYAGFFQFSGSAKITGSTFTGNHMGMNAGGFIQLTNSTVFDNDQHGLSGNVIMHQSTVVESSVGDFAFQNATGSLIVGGCSTPFTNISGNVFSDASCSNNGAATPDLALSVAPVLAANGCADPCTHTLALLPGSPAVDVYTYCPAGVDQRGEPRTAASCDAGAFEAGDCVPSLTAGSEFELGFAIGCYNVGAVPRSVTMTSDIVLAQPLPPINNALATPPVLTFDGGGFTLNADDGDQLFVTDGLYQVAGNVALSDLTIRGAHNHGFVADGGTVSIAGSTFLGMGYGIQAVSADVSVVNSTFYDQGTAGVRLAEGSSITIDRSTISNDAVGLLGEGAGGSATLMGSLISTGQGNCQNIAGLTHAGTVFSNFFCANSFPDVDTTIGDSLDIALAANGCTEPCTHTLALLGPSSARDKNTACDGGVDQRGMARTVGKCDSGAFELDDCPTTFTVDTQDELAHAIQCYGSAATDIAITMTGDILVTQNLPQVENTNAATLNLDGAGNTLRAGSGEFRPMSGLVVRLGASLALSSLTIADFGIGVFVEEGSLLMTGSTLTGNDYGLIVEAPPSLAVESSTITGNAVAGVIVQGFAEFSLFNSTLVDNGESVSMDGSGGIVALFGGGAAPVVTLGGSLIAGNLGPECSTGLVFTDEGGNVIEDTSCLGVSTAALAGSYASALAPNGCTEPCTDTIALLPGSPAIDANSVCSAGTTDQRGESRAAGKCDAGAFELGDLDADGDGFEGPLGDNADCDDDAAGVNPGATEIAIDGIDQNCDGEDLVEAFCNGLLVTIDMNTGALGVGTAGADVILGTPGPDVIDAGAGDDTVCAGDGDDTVVGGDGDDTLFGGNGRDIMRGNTGEDVLEGEAGNDRLLGGIDADTLNGGDGDDFLGGFGGNDIINGGPGNEVIFGGFGGDTINGGPGDDEIHGLIGDDLINGGPGKDTIDGDRGNDTINGGGGDDIIRGGNAADTLNGDGGNDSVSGGRADDALSGGAGNADVCVGNKHIIADTADATCETIFGVP